MDSIEKMFSENVLEKMRRVIAGNEGNEVFFQGVYNSKKKIVNQIEPLAYGTANAVAAKLSLQSPYNVVVHNHPGGDVNPSPQDNHIASILLNDEIGFLIVDNEASKCKIVVEPVALNSEQKIEPSEIEDIFSPEGKLSKSHKEFEYRQPQHEMAKEVSYCFNKKIHTIIEAPTGTGKSIAYLVPMALWSKKNNKRVLVCTNTLNLQKQLIDKDIPIVKDIVGDFKVAIVKGRRNYLCLRKLAEIEMTQRELFESFEEPEVEKVLNWAKQTTTGSKSELSSVDYSVWESVASDSDSCVGLKCRYSSECYFRKARKESAEANLLIANHAIFFSDLALRGELGNEAEVSVFPSCQRFVLDEAHNIESVATNHFGYTLSYPAMAKRVGKLFRQHRTSNKAVGLLVHVKAKMDLLTVELDPLNATHKKYIIPVFKKGMTKLKHDFKELNRIVKDRIQGTYERKIRINKEEKATPFFKEMFLPVIQSIEAVLAHMESSLRQLISLWNELDTDLREDSESEFIQLNSYKNRFKDAVVFLNNMINDEDENSVYWLEFSSFKDVESVELKMVPIDVGRILNEYFYKNQSGVIYTSATLAVKNGFDFFKGRVGLNRVDQIKLRARVLDQVFDYQKQALLAIPGPFSDTSSPEYIEEFSQFVAKLIPVTKGRIFLLFTSWRMLNNCHERVLELLPKKWQTSCLKQGQYSRSYMIEEFLRLGNSSLFGVSSFWEGVDLKGDDLVAVVIAKLPFQVPTEPVIKARNALIEKSGKNSFMEYSLPNAVIRLKQGFGRLIRGKNDYGIVFVLDHRIVTKPYGRTFIESLPAVAISKNSPENIIEETEKFLKRFE